VHSQPQSIDRVLVLGPSVGLLLALFGCIMMLIEMAGLSPGQIPLPGTGGPPLTEPNAGLSAVAHPAETRKARGVRSLSVAHRGDRGPRDRLPDRHAATIDPVPVDPSRDRRADLQDMAIAIRWHRGAASDLPPGSD
jgi:hypothetical protein